MGCCALSFHPRTNGSKSVESGREGIDVVKFLTISKLQAGAAILAASLALALAACGGGGGSGFNSGGNCLGYGGGGGGGGNGSGCTGNPAPSPSPAASAAAVGVLLTGENAVTTASDGMVRGFFNGTAHTGSTDSGVVNLTASTNVQFVNVEAAGGFPHTASYLGPYSGSYPGSFTNTNGPTASAAGASISSANFSAGNLNPGAVSQVYSTGGPGMFIFGCAYHYLSDNMRTVVVVH